jgi:hypothetical protein
LLLLLLLLELLGFFLRLLRKRRYWDPLIYRSPDSTKVDIGSRIIIDAIVVEEFFPLAVVVPLLGMNRKHAIQGIPPLLHLREDVLTPLINPVLVAPQIIKSEAHQEDRED